MSGIAVRKVRPLASDRWGFAWEPDELPDMTVEEARLLLQAEAEAQALGSFGNEDPNTLQHARVLVEAAGHS